ncbi:MAG TPA: hypothetical protein VK158_06670 [Acidobacteriota bacterium]|nr:hypothetical protein [Acidobacteriota bacterium]
MTKNLAKVVSHNFVRSPGFFAPQYNDGLAYLQFADGHTMSFALRSAPFEGQIVGMSATLRAKGLPLHELWSDDSGRGISTIMTPEDFTNMRNYLVASLEYASRSAEKRFIGPSWRKQNYPFYAIVAVQGPRLLDAMDSGTLRLPKYSSDDLLPN